MIWNVDPILFSFSGFTVRWYGLLFITGFLVSFEALKRIFRRDGLSLELLDSLLIYMMISTVIGARLGHCLFYEPGYFMAHPLEILMVWHGGLASHGGFLGIFLGLALFAHRKSVSLMYLLDRVPIFALMSGAFVRLGNFMNSEIIGKPTDLPWAVVFKRVDMVPRHPTQIYEALSYFVISGIAWKIERSRKGQVPAGFLFGFILTFGFLARFTIEFLKENQEAFEQSLFLNMGQLLSLLPVALGIGLMIRSRGRAPARPMTVSPEETRTPKKRRKKKNS